MELECGNEPQNVVLSSCSNSKSYSKICMQRIHKRKMVIIFKGGNEVNEKY